MDDKLGKRNDVLPVWNLEKSGLEILQMTNRIRNVENQGQKKGILSNKVV